MTDEKIAELEANATARPWIELYEGQGFIQRPFGEGYGETIAVVETKADRQLITVAVNLFEKHQAVVEVARYVASIEPFGQTTLGTVLRNALDAFAKAKESLP